MKNTYLARNRIHLNRIGIFSSALLLFLLAPVHQGLAKTYAVFQVGNEVMVGERSELEARPVCKMTGWGTDCTKTAGQVATFKPIEKLGSWTTPEQARQAYCNDIISGTPRVTGRYTGTRDWEAKFKFDGNYHLIRNAPAPQGVRIGWAGRCLGEPTRSHAPFQWVLDQCSLPPPISEKIIDEFLDFLATLLQMGIEKASAPPSDALIAIRIKSGLPLPPTPRFSFKDAADQGRFVWDVAHGLEQASINQVITLNFSQAQRTKIFGHWADWLERRAKGEWGIDSKKPTWSLFGPIHVQIPTPPQLIGKKPGWFRRWLETDVWDFGVTSTVQILSLPKWYTAAALAAWHAYNEKPSPGLKPGEVDIKRTAPVLLTALAYVPYLGPSMVAALTAYSEANIWGETYAEYERTGDLLGTLARVDWAEQVAALAASANLALSAKLTHDLKKPFQAAPGAGIDEGQPPPEIRNDPAFAGKGYREVPRAVDPGQAPKTRVRHPHMNADLVEVEYVVMGKHLGKADPRATWEKKRALMVGFTDQEGNYRHMTSRIEEFSLASIRPNDLIYGAKGPDPSFNRLRKIQSAAGRGKLLDDHPDPPERWDTYDGGDSGIMAKSKIILDQEVRKGNRVIFDLTAMDDLPGVIAGETYRDKITSQELRYINENWGRQFNDDNVIFVREVNGLLQRVGAVWNGTGVDPFFAVGSKGYHMWKHLTERNGGFPTGFASLMEVLGGRPEYAGELNIIGEMAMGIRPGGVDGANTRYITLMNKLVADQQFQSLATGYYRYVPAQGSPSLAEANYFVQVPKTCGPGSQGNQPIYPIRVSIDPKTLKLKNVFVLNPRNPRERFKPDSNLQNQFVDWRNLDPAYYAFRPMEQYLCPSGQCGR
jgi:hypothetical protein